VTEDDNLAEHEKLEKSIESLELRAQTLKQVQRIIKELDELATVTVVNEDNSPQIHVIAGADTPLDGLQELAEVDTRLYGEAHSPADIVYQPGDETYKLEMKFSLR
jgi:predicted ABC-type transport system involved in lysophospholipase L1 biosynthesis ATPase subunit